MNRTMVNCAVIVLMSATLLALTGCQSDAGTGALIGTGVGAGVGALAGGGTEGTLIGAAVGGGAGYMLGNEGDKKKQKQATDEKFAQVNNNMNTVMVNVTNSNGSIIQVPLKKQGVGYLGPRGEYYPKFPTESDLRTVYGF